ncbi:MAG: hypothetical protein P8O16_05490 [Algoriphagus sp.]|jgi:hypothetical protein|uniref:hypothetical protein n=1 Tax=Algoriphagus sp. TaxID=1872435 RepID=UPI00260CC052|nr:hypothetical protein [Algoriphagus sp.]MDG1276714.1 hypothetical protein [Algoriphagus sp.]
MKKYVLTLSILLISLGFSFAQRSTERYDPEKLQAARIAFITTRLDLTPPQAEKFWPVFNQYSDMREALLKEMSALSDSRNGQITESDAKKRVEQRFEIQKKLLTYEEKFVADISKVISYNQILALNGLARDFTRQLYQRQRKEN